MTNRFSITPAAYIFGALFFLLLPLRWIISVVSAAMIHELFHYLAIKAFRGDVYFFAIDTRGICMEVEEMPPIQELICTLAGPAGSLLLTLLWEKLPMIAFCGFVQGVFNLLPVYPLDGGRIVYCIFRCFFSEDRANRACRAVYTVTAILIILVTVFCMHLYSFNWFIFVISFILFLKVLKYGNTSGRKTPCKTGSVGLQ